MFESGDEMYKVCFVDDEIINHKLLMNLVDWQCHNFIVCGTATDGEEGLALFKQENPDLMLIDIKMPLMDGLECIRRIRLADTRVKLVLVTALSEFKYAKQAISLGVEDYLIKPVVRQDLNALVLKIKETLDDEHLLSSALIDLEKEHRENKLKLIFQQAFLITKNKGTLSPENIHQLSELFTLPLDIIDFHLYTEQMETLSHADCQLITTVITDFFIRNNINVYTILPNESSRLIFIIQYNHFRKQSFYTDLSNILQSKSYLSDIYVLNERLTEKNISDVLDALIHAPSRAFYSNDSSITTLMEIPKFTKSMQPNNEPFDSCITAALDTLSYKPLMKILDSLFAKNLEDNTHPFYMIDQCFNLLIELKLCLKKHFSFDTFLMLRAINTDELYAIHKSKVLYRFMEQCFIKTFEELNAQSQVNGKNSLPVMRAELYTQEHFCEHDFSVLRVSKQIGFSKNYFLKIYKEIKGINFWDYVIALRIEKAKSMLKDTNNTIAAISDAIGYKSEYHFSRKFKEVVGTSPHQYRKN